MDYYTAEIRIFMFLFSTVYVAEIMFISNPQINLSKGNEFCVVYHELQLFQSYFQFLEHAVI
jgi:hypothetical protein